MSVYSVAEAKNNLSRLIEQTEAGEEVVISRHGKVVAELRAKQAKTPVDRAALYDWLLEAAKSRPIGVSSTDLIRRMRDEGL